MPRLLGVEIPAKKKVAYSLRYINGIGPTRADLLVKEAGLNPDMRAQDLTEEQLNKILHIITEHKWVLEGDLRREIAGNLKRLQAINCYRGIRHRRSLPVRGQRTSTNARTRKGPRKTVGVTQSQRSIILTVMAEEKSAPKKEKPVKAAPVAVEGAAPASAAARLNVRRRKPRLRRPVPTVLLLLRQRRRSLLKWWVALQSSPRPKTSSKKSSALIFNSRSSLWRTF